MPFTKDLRFFNVFGTRQALSNPYTGMLAIFASRLLNGRPPLVYEDGEQQRDVINVDDELLFNLPTDRYERGATVVATNLSLAEWLSVFAGDDKLTTALLKSARASPDGDHDQRQELSPAPASWT